MIEEIGTTVALAQDGKLHKMLQTRIALNGILFLIFGGIGVYDLFLNINPIIPIISFVFGFGLGAFLLSQVIALGWDEKKEVIRAGRIDLFGIGILVLYVLFRIIFREYLISNYTNAEKISGITFLSLSGAMLGRFISSSYTIHKIYKSRRGN